MFLKLYLEFKVLRIRKWGNSNLLAPFTVKAILAGAAHLKVEKPVCEREMRIQLYSTAIIIYYIISYDYRCE